MSGNFVTIPLQGFSLDEEIDVLSFATKCDGVKTLNVIRHTH